MREAAIGALFLAALGVSACQTNDLGDGGHRDRHGGYSYDGRDYHRLGNDCASFGGPGGDMLDPWLACTEEGENLVRIRYARDGGLDEEDADEANVWFRRHADTNHDLCLTDGEIKAALVNAARHYARR
jgi:hypothetical protein